MAYEFRELKRRIEWTYWKWRRLVVLRWLSLILLTVLVAGGSLAILDWRLLLPQWLRLALLAGTGISLVTITWWSLIRPLRHRPSFDRIARHIEQHHPDLEDRLVTAVEFGERQPIWASPQLLDRLIQDASLRTSTVNFGGTISGRGTAILSLIAFVAFLFGLSYVLPQLRLHGLDLSRITRPWQTPNPSNEPHIVVLPGHKKVPRGAEEIVTAEISGIEPENVMLYFSEDDSLWQKTEMDVTEIPGRYTFNLYNIETQTRYYVKAGELLSDIFTLSVYDAPRVLRLDLTYRFPDYTGLPSKTETDGGDIWAPAGTVVTIEAITDRAVAGGELLIGESTQVKAKIREDTVAVASLTVSGDGYYRFSVWDDTGLKSTADPEYYIHLVPDQRPEITLLKPGQDRKATKIEEVPVRIQVADDFGLAALQMTYSVNERPEETVDLFSTAQIDTLTAETGSRFTVEYTLFLEDLGVAIGDFLSYFIEAVDRGQDGKERKVNTDIYFIEVRPFEQEFFRPVAQQGGGMQGGAGFQLAQTQKEIITATWKLQRRRDQLQPDAFEEARQALATTQRNLMEAVSNILTRLEERALFTGDEGRQLVQHLQNAREAMERAVQGLDVGDLEAAQGPEKEAYHHLLRAEAEQRQRQVARANAGGAPQVATAQELAELFEEELDKVDNRYETLQQEQSRQMEAEVDEALQKVRELARRQGELNRAARELARQDLSPEEMRRQIDQLRRRQEELNREARQLARQMDRLRRGGESMSGSSTSDLRQAANEMNSASNSLRQQDPNQAAAKGSKALDRLQDLEQRLRQGQRQSLAQRLDRLQQDVDRLRQQEERLLKELEELAESDDAAQRRQAAEALAAAKRAQRRQAEKMKRDLQETAGSARDSNPELSRELQKVRRETESQRLTERMAESETLLEQNRFNSALEAEKATQEQLDRLAERLDSARQLLAESEAEQLQHALDQTRTLRDQLESLMRAQAQEGQTRQERSLAEAGERSQGEQQPGQPQGRPGQQGNPTGRRAPAEGARSNELLDPAQLERLREGLWRGLGSLRSIGESVRVDTMLHSDMDQLAQEWSGIVRNFRGGSPERLRDVENRILVPLREFEAELEQRLQLMESKEKLFFAREEKVPPEYQSFVEKYYEALSKRSPKR